MPADWHYHPTAHGKNSYGNIGDILKREATSASLQASATNPRTNATTLFTWAQKHFSNLKIMYFTKEMHRKAEVHLKRRFSN